MNATKPRPPVLAYFTGLDLGRSGEFTAVAVVERTQPAGSHKVVKSAAKPKQNGAAKSKPAPATSNGHLAGVVAPIDLTNNGAPIVGKSVS